jgi:hypothetical protein
MTERRSVRAWVLPLLMLVVWACSGEPEFSHVDRTGQALTVTELSLSLGDRPSGPRRLDPE